MIRDSGKRIQMAGMVRDIADDKIKYHLVFDGPMFDRWAKHLTDGAKKYGERNWQNAHTQEELDRFVESAVRHFIQWLYNEGDEDHAAAVFFNINGVEHIKSLVKDNYRFPSIQVKDESPSTTGTEIRHGIRLPIED